MDEETKDFILTAVSQALDSLMYKRVQKTDFVLGNVKVTGYNVGAMIRIDVKGLNREQ